MIDCNLIQEKCMYCVFQSFSSLTHMMLMMCLKAAQFAVNAALHKLQQFVLMIMHIWEHDVPTISQKL